jgi:hypothetical protein
MDSLPGNVAVRQIPWPARKNEKCHRSAAGALPAARKPRFTLGVLASIAVGVADEADWESSGKK